MGAEVWIKTGNKVRRRNWALAKEHSEHLGDARNNPFR